MPRLNGKFVSQATYDAHQADWHTVQEDTMTDNIETTETETVEKTDKRHGVRPTTLLKRALIAEVNAEIALNKAQEKVNAFEAKGQNLRDAADAARLALEAATEAVLAARSNV